MVSVAPYLDNIRVVAQQQDVPLFDRFAIMHHWNETGEFDLFAAHADAGWPKRVHDCLGRGARCCWSLDAAELKDCPMMS